MMLWTAAELRAQVNAPILSGGVQFLSSSVGGNTSFQPAISPVLVVPLGEHWLVESRADLRGFIAQDNGSTGPYSGQFIASLEYLQLDYIANSYLTMTVGRFLTPFNIYDERFTPFWIRDLQDVPMIFPIGTRTTGSNNGFMFRGVIAAQKAWEVNYTAYFSVLSTTENLQSGRTAGGRMGVFLPLAGVEVGVSYQRFLQDVNYNSVGTYFTWQPTAIPWMYAPNTPIPQPARAIGSKPPITSRRPETIPPGSAVYKASRAFNSSSRELLSRALTSRRSTSIALILDSTTICPTMFASTAATAGSTAPPETPTSGKPRLAIVFCSQPCPECSNENHIFRSLGSRSLRHLRQRFRTVEGARSASCQETRCRREINYRGSGSERGRAALLRKLWTLPQSPGIDLAHVSERRSSAYASPRH
jgi:hypothetical protein